MEFWRDVENRYAPVRVRWCERNVEIQLNMIEEIQQKQFPRYGQWNTDYPEK